MTNLNAEQLEKVQRRVLNQQPRPDEYLKEVKNALDFYNFDTDASDFIEQVVHRIAKTNQPSDTWPSDLPL